MNESSNATVSPAVEQLWRDAFLGASSRATMTVPDESVTSSSLGAAQETALVPNVVVNIQRLASWSISGSIEGVDISTEFVSGNDKNIAADAVLAATQPEEIIVALSLEGRYAAAERISDLNAMSKDDPDEAAIVLASLRELALFFLSQRQLVDPAIGLSPDGLLLVEWASPERGVLAMKFLTDGMIQFAGVSAIRHTGRRLRVEGRLPKDRALDAVRAFIP